MLPPLVGPEDSVIPVPIAVTVGDPDGSESFIMYVETTNLPAGTKLFGANGLLDLPAPGGRYVLTPADVAALAVQPPLHWSSALPSQGDLKLLTTTVTTETGIDDVSSMPLEVPIKVVGVADKPNFETLVVDANEDEPYDVGAAVAALGPLEDILVDQDGSESLYLLIKGLPNGVIPQSDIPGGVSYLGNGKYQVSQEAIGSLKIPPISEYSGDNPFVSMRLRATSQEMDGSQANSNWWTVNFAIQPVVDGFGDSWVAETTVTEGDTEAGIKPVSFASIEEQQLIDGDSSETVLAYLLDFSNLIQDAGIGVHMVDNLSISSLSELVNTYLTGKFEFDEATGIVTVQAGDIAGVALEPQLFKDSNQDFSVPVDVLVRDIAVIRGEKVTREGYDPGTFHAHLTGTADIPTVYAKSTSGSAGELIPLALGGETTDTDKALGREESESVFYVLQYLNPPTGSTRWTLTDGAGEVVGYNQGDLSWILEKEDVEDIHLYAPFYGDEDERMEFRLTSVAVENDGDIAMNDTLFTVDIEAVAGNGDETLPLPPTVDINDHSGIEDTDIALSVVAAEDPEDGTNPKITIVLSDIPNGARVDGAIRNPITGKYVAKAEDVDLGLVRITPPRDFSGTMPVTVEAVATNRWGLTATSGEKQVDFYVDPVADGAGISFSAVDINGKPGLTEDEDFVVGISMKEIDVDGSEKIGELTYVKFDNIANLQGGFPLVAAGDPDSTILGKSVVGYYRIESNNLSALTVEPLEHWHGDVSVSVITTVVEPLDDEDGDHIKLAQASTKFFVAPVADAPIVEVPTDPLHGNEDEWIPIGDDLRVALVDKVKTNGAETLSVVMSGIPTDSILSSGANNGDGSWTIPANELSKLSILPPENYAGTMDLTLTGIAVEASHGYSEAKTSKNFTLMVAPVADSFLMVAENPTLESTADRVALELNIRMLGTRDGEPLQNELPPETLSLQFDDVPPGLVLSPEQGGTVTGGPGSFSFTGTEEQANSLSLVRSGSDLPSSGETDQYTVSISGITNDSGAVLETPVLDSFVLYVRPANRRH